MLSLKVKCHYRQDKFLDNLLLEFLNWKILLWNPYQNQRQITKIPKYKGKYNNTETKEQQIDKNKQITKRKTNRQIKITETKEYVEKCHYN